MIKAEEEERMKLLMDFRTELKRRLIVFDGAMGTMIQRYGLKPGQPPETFNILHPEIIEEIHRKYIEAGADVITTNTFGANELKLKGTGYTVEQVISQAVALARRAAGSRWVALDMGPIGQLMEPMGPLSFEQAYELYARQVKAGVQAGVDLILIETLGDLYEAKAAVLAAKENSSLPVICTLTFDQSGRTLTGTDPLTAVVVLEGLGVDALGVNCSLGPEGLLPIVKEFLSYSSIPVLVQPNAGLPQMVDGRAVYPLTPEVFQRHILTMVQMGVRLVGGCCGTTPDFIRAIRQAVDGLTPAVVPAKKFTAVASGSKAVILDQGVKLIGGRINARFNESIARAIQSNNMGDVVSEAIAQRSQGADMLAIDVAIPEIDEKEAMLNLVREIQAVVNLPLELDSLRADVLEAAMRLYNGKPLVRGVSAEQAVMDSVFPAVAKYGPCVVGYTRDEKGTPVDAKDRLKMAERIVSAAESYGVPKENVIIDCTVADVVARPSEAMEALKAIRLIKDELGLVTTLDIREVCRGWPNDDSVGSTYLAMALAYGLDAPVVDPGDARTVETVKAFRLLSGQR
jgi:5-methyltetrahydrofolate--homocysteine methyltransferase